MITSKSFGSVSGDIISPSEDHNDRPNPFAADYRPDHDHFSPADDSQDEGAQEAEGVEELDGVEEADGAEGADGADGVPQQAQVPFDGYFTFFSFQ